MALLHTTLGTYTADQLGMILPHEHVFVDLRLPDVPGHGAAETADVIALMGPEIEAVKALGVTALVECSAAGIALRADIDLAVSRATGLPIVLPTGVYREPWIPAWVHVASDAALHDWMLAELETGIGDTGVRAGFIKLGASDDGLTPSEERQLRIAARVSAETGALIGVHTLSGRVALAEIDIIEAEGGSAGRFVHIHTQAEPDFGLHRAVAARGAFIEYDNVGWAPVEDSTALVLRALDAGLGDRLLLSHDAGWYDAAKPGGGTPKPYTVVSEKLLPRLAAAGVDANTLRRLTHANPFAAFAR